MPDWYKTHNASMPVPEATTALEPVTRPDGRLCRPRRLVAHAVVNEDEILCGVVVLGTCDPGRAQALADQYAQWQIGANARAVNPLPGWYRDGFENGRRTWVSDEVRGRAGVWFRDIVEVSRA